MRSPSPPAIAIGLAAALACACEEGGLLIPEDTGVEGESESEGEGGGAACDPDEALALFDPERLARIDLEFDRGWLEKNDHDADGWGEPGTCRKREDEGCPGDQGWLWDYWSRCPGPQGRQWASVTFRYSHDGGEPETLEDVGLRFRGGYPDVSQDDRNGFKINFDPDREPDATGQRQRFHGLNGLNVLSLDPDFSLVKQCLSYRLADDFGIPAPRCNHVEVYVEGERYGLFPHVEERDDMRYVCHRFGREGETAGELGELYSALSRDCDAAPNSLEYRGDAYADYERAYAIESLQEGEAAEDAGRPLVEMLDCMRQERDEDFGECVQDWIDVDEWLGTIAFEAVLPTAESMSGSSRNFFLFFRRGLGDPHGGRFQVYLWDMDIGYDPDLCAVWDVEACGLAYQVEDVKDKSDCVSRAGERCDLWGAVPTWARHPPNAFNYRLRQAFRDRYCERVAEFVTEVYTLDHVYGRIDAIRGVIEAAVKASDGWRDEDIEGDVAERRAEVIDQLAADCDLEVE